MIDNKEYKSANIRKSGAAAGLILFQEHIQTGEKPK